MRRSLGIIIGGLIILVVLGVLAVRALLPPPAGRVVVEGEYTLDQPAAGRLTIFADTVTVAAPVSGDLIVFARSFTLAQNGRVDGSLWLVSDTYTHLGAVTGDLVAISDQFTLSEAGAVNGALTLMTDSAQIDGGIGGGVNISAGSVNINPQNIDGRLRICAQTISGVTEAVCERAGQFALLESLIALRAGGTSGAAAQAAWSAPLLSGELSAVLALLAGSLSIVGASALAVAAFPRQIGRIEDAMRAQPRSMWGAGLAVYGLTAGVTVMMLVLVGISGSFGVLVVLAWLLFALGVALVVLAGWMTLSLMVGEWLLRRLRKTPPPLVTAGVGGLALWSVWALVGLLPLSIPLTLLALALISAVGTGAALFTVFGSRPLRGSYFVQG